MKKVYGFLIQIGNCSASYYVEEGGKARINTGYGKIFFTVKDGKAKDPILILDASPLVRKIN